MNPRVEDLVFGRAFSPGREKKGAESASPWRPRCGRRLREEAPSHTASGRAPSNKTLSGHLRSRPSVRSVTNFPGFLPRRPPPLLRASSRAADTCHDVHACPSSVLNARPETRPWRIPQKTPLRSVFFVLIKRGWVSTWRKLISARRYAATTLKNGGHKEGRGRNFTARSIARDVVQRLKRTSCWSVIYAARDIRYFALWRYLMKHVAINISSTECTWFDSVDTGVLIASRVPYHTARDCSFFNYRSIGNPSKLFPSCKNLFLKRGRVKARKAASVFPSRLFCASIQNSIDHQQPARAGNVHVFNSTRMN